MIATAADEPPRPTWNQLVSADYDRAENLAGRFFDQIDVCRFFDVLDAATSRGEARVEAQRRAMDLLIAEVTVYLNKQNVEVH